jgi:hypothetical protein
MTAADRAARRHVREKATVDRLVKGIKRRPEPSRAEQEHQDGATTSTGLPVEDQVRKEWGPAKGGLPTFGRSRRRFLSPRFLACRAGATRSIGVVDFASKTASRIDNNCGLSAARP